MIKVKIGESERDRSNADAQWINEQINRRRAEGKSVCVRVTIDSSPVNFMLSTPQCGSSGGGGGRPLNADETKILSYWEKLHLNTDGFTGGNLVAFLRQIS